MDWYKKISGSKMGPLTVGGFLKGIAGFLVVWVMVAIIASVVPNMGTAPSGEGATPGFIETFTLDQARPYREFYDGRLRIELISSASDEYMKTVKIRVVSDALKAEYSSDYEEHTFIEMIQGYVGNPLPEEPFKCLEGWIYHKESSPGSVTLSLHESKIKIDSGGYRFNVFLSKNWKYFIMFLGYIALAVALYYYVPFFWGFISIQLQARAHALATGFESYPVIFYIVKKLPLLLCFYLFFHFFFNYEWKGVVAAALIGIGLQLYFNWHNQNQLVSYAEKKHLISIEGTKNSAFQGRIKETPVTLSVGGTFVLNPYYDRDSNAGSHYSYLSFLVIQASLNTTEWQDLVLWRDKKEKWGWDSSRNLDDRPAAGSSLTAMSKFPKYSIGRIEVIDGKLTTVKVFAPDSPAEINLLVDYMVDLAGALK